MVLDVLVELQADTSGWLTVGWRDAVEVAAAGGTVLATVAGFWALVATKRQDVRNKRLRDNGRKRAHDRDVLSRILEFAVSDDVVKGPMSFRRAPFSEIRKLSSESKARLDLTLLFFGDDRDELLRRVTEQGNDPTPQFDYLGRAIWDRAAQADGKYEPQRLVLDKIYDELIGAIDAVVQPDEE